MGKVKQFFSLILAILLVIPYLPTAYATDDFPEDPETIEIGHLDEDSIYSASTSKKRSKYYELLNGNYKNGELKEKFEETFGIMSPEFIRNNYENLFDIGKDEIDEGFLEAICYDGEKDFYIDDEPLVFTEFQPLSNIATQLPTTTDYDIKVQLDVIPQYRPEEDQISRSGSIASVSLVSKTTTSITLDLKYIDDNNSNNALQMRDSLADSNEWPIRNAHSSRITISGLRPGVKYTFWAGTFYNGSWYNSEGLVVRTDYPEEVLVSYSRSNIDFKLDKILTDIWGTTITGEFLDRTNAGYDVIYDLVGGKKPFSGDKMQLLSTRTLEEEIEGKSGQPMRWQTTGNIYLAAVDHAYQMKKNNVYTTETPYHEISHNFDNAKWTFEPEALAILKIYYFYSTTENTMMVAGQSQSWSGKAYKQYMKSHAHRLRGHINYDEAMSKGVYSPYSLAYNLGDIADRIGWDAYKDTFRFFDQTAASSIPTTKLGKLNLFLSKLSDFSGQDVFSMLTTGEKDLYEDYFGGEIKYTTIEEKPEEYSTAIKGVIYPADSLLTPVVDEDDLNGHMEILNFKVEDSRFSYEIKIDTPNGGYSSWTVRGSKTMFRNPSDLVAGRNILLSRPDEKDSDKNWQLINLSLESPAIEDILLPANRTELTGKNIFKFAFRYKYTGEIFYFEGALPVQTLYDEIAAVSSNAMKKPDVRDNLHNSLTWFFNYLEGEGDVQDGGENEIALLSETQEHMDWRDVIPDRALTQLGKWVSIGFNRQDSKKNWGYYTEVYKYPKNSPQEQDFYGWEATDLITWEYTTSGIQDEELICAASIPRCKPGTQLHLRHAGQLIRDIKAGEEFFNEKIQAFFIENVEIGIAVKGGAEIIEQIDYLHNLSSHPSSSVDIKGAFKFFAGHFEPGKVINKAITVADLIKTTGTEGLHNINDVFLLNSTLAEQINGNYKGLIQSFKVTSCIDGVEHPLMKKGDYLGLTASVVNPIPDDSVENWNRFLGAEREIIFSYEFDICTEGIKPNGYNGVVSVVEPVRNIYTGDIPYKSIRYTMDLTN